jgi:hypothetical protein
MDGRKHCIVIREAKGQHDCIHMAVAVAVAVAEAEAEADEFCVTFYPFASRDAIITRSMRLCRLHHYERSERMSSGGQPEGGRK